MSPPTIQWYPGHIAKAENQLSKNLNKVDLVVEVRDARIPKATSHPHLTKWVHGKKHLLVINRKDMVSAEAQKLWDQSLRKTGKRPYWCNAKTGNGVKQLFDAAICAGNELNERRRSRGMRKRPVRALILGFPNVGKSALINRLVRKKVVESARRAGITRSLRWIRLGQDLDLLDAPGILPPKLDDQKAALMLALCDDIGEASYDIENICIALLNMLQDLEGNTAAAVSLEKLDQRYGLPFEGNKKNLDQWLLAIAQRHTSGNTSRMAQRLVDDFRQTFLGKISLELP